MNWVGRLTIAMLMLMVIYLLSATMVELEIINSEQGWFVLFIASLLGSILLQFGGEDA